MKRHGHLFEQITAFHNLLLAARKTFRGHKNTPEVARFLFHLEPELLQLQEELQTGRYQPRPYRIFEIREPKTRQICAASVRDRVVHHAICNLIDPIFERQMIGTSFACRKDKGTHAAVAEVQRLTRRFHYVLQCDIRKYFASIDHQTLKSLIRRTIKDFRLLTVLDQIIDFPLPGHEPGKGIPIGNLTSQHFANMYLDKLDHFVKEDLSIKGYVRYMDDFLMFGNNKDDLHQTNQSVKQFLGEKLRLELKRETGLLVPVTHGISFLGFRIFPGLIRVTGQNAARFRRKIRKLEAAFEAGVINETELSRSVTSVVSHIRHADTLAFRKKLVYPSLKIG